MSNKKVKNIKSFKTIFRILENLQKKRKYQLFLTLIILIISSFAEIIAISSFMPFLEIILGSNEPLKNNYIINFINFFYPGITNINLTTITTFFISTIIVAALIRLFNIWINIRLAAAIGSDIGIKAFESLVNKPYKFFITSNSSTILSISTLYVNYVSQIVKQFLTFFTSLILSFSIIAVFAFYKL